MSNGMENPVYNLLIIHHFRTLFTTTTVLVNSSTNTAGSLAISRQKHVSDKRERGDFVLCVGDAFNFIYLINMDVG